jgi:hypothetical protein
MKDDIQGGGKERKKRKKERKKKKHAGKWMIFLKGVYFLSHIHTAKRVNDIITFIYIPWAVSPSFPFLLSRVLVG